VNFGLLKAYKTSLNPSFLCTPSSPSSWQWEEDDDDDDFWCLLSSHLLLQVSLIWRKRNSWIYRHASLSSSYLLLMYVYIQFLWHSILHTCWEKLCYVSVNKFLMYIKNFLFFSPSSSEWMCIKVWILLLWWKGKVRLELRWESNV